MRNTPKIFNLGADTDLTLDEFFIKSKIETNHSGEVKFIWNSEDDVIPLKPLGEYSNNSKIKESIKWHQRVSYSQGLKKTIDFIKKGPDRDYDRKE